MINNKYCEIDLLNINLKSQSWEAVRDYMIYILRPFHLSTIAFAKTNFQTSEEWQFVFFVTASIYLFGAIFYSLTASGERQEWSKLVPYEESHVWYSEWGITHFVENHFVKNNKDDQKILQWSLCQKIWSITLPNLTMAFLPMESKTPIL